MFNDFKPVSQEEKDKALADLFKNEVTPPASMMEIFLGDEIRENIVDYMVRKIKKHYGISSTNEALKMWNRYRMEVLKE